MPDGSAPTNASRKPKASLSDMLTVAVGLVDRAANERIFLVQKAEQMSDAAATGTTKDAPTPPLPEGGAAPPAPAPAPPGEGALKLPAAAKQAISDVLENVLGTLAAVGELVAGATVDETAAVPPELSRALDQSADQLDELADSFSPETPELESAYGAHKPPPAPTPGGQQAPPPSEEQKAEIAKAAVVDAMKKSVVRKAVRRMGKARLTMLQQAHDMQGNAHGMVGSLIRELTGDPDAPAMTPAAAPPPSEAEKKKPAQAPPPPAAPPSQAPADEQIKKAVSDAIAPYAAELASLRTGVAKADAAGASTDATTPVQKGAPNSRAPDASAGGASSRNAPVAWEQDLSAAAVKSKAAPPKK